MSSLAGQSAPDRRRQAPEAGTDHNDVQWLRVQCRRCRAGQKGIRDGRGRRQRGRLERAGQTRRAFGSCGHDPRWRSSVKSESRSRRFCTAGESASSLRVGCAAARISISAAGPPATPRDPALSSRLRLS